LQPDVLQGTRPFLYKKTLTASLSRLINLDITNFIGHPDELREDTIP
jgi:hypothetical protein